MVALQLDFPVGEHRLWTIHAWNGSVQLFAMRCCPKLVAMAACSHNQAWPRAAEAAVQGARPGAALLMLLEPLLSFPQGPLEEGGFHDYVF